MIPETVCLVHMQYKSTDFNYNTFLVFSYHLKCSDEWPSSNHRKKVIQSLHPCQTYPYTAELDEKYIVLRGLQCRVQMMNTCLLTFRMFWWNLLKKHYFLNAVVFICASNKSVKKTHTPAQDFSKYPFTFNFVIN